MNGERYKVGDKVYHDTFGDGIILDKINNGKIVIVVHFYSLNDTRNIIASFHGIRRKK